MVNVTKSPPPVLSVPAPFFVDKLTNKVMTAGDRLEYPLGAVKDPSDLPVTASLSAPGWVIFDAKTYTITVLEKTTDAKIAGQGN